jgi:Domain of unknown function (DUF4276)
VRKRFKVKVYVEGGGDREDLRTACRRGFTEFFKKAGLESQLPQIIACGGRTRAYDHFQTAVQQNDPRVFPLLLADSEGPVNDPPWRHLKLRVDDNWDRPEGARDDQVHLMVQCMESWLLADRECLAEYFGQGFSEKSLPAKQRDIEAIGKGEILASLAEATRKCKTKAPYKKGKHSFVLLARIDPGKVLEKSPHAKRLLDALKSL